MSTQPRYLKINGTWYVSRQHMAEQMERVIALATDAPLEWISPEDVANRALQHVGEEIVTQ